MHRGSLTLDRAVDLTRTGDIWLFRGRSGADRTIRALTNAPVNHVGMAVVLDDLPPLMWHAELGKGLACVWSGGHHRGVQLHDLREAVVQWCGRYEQRAWVRQLDAHVTRDQEDAVLRTIARLDGTPFPSTAALTARWARGRVARRAAWVRGAGGRTTTPATQPAGVESTYCAEVVAATYAAMGLLPADRPTHSYDPGSFWSGDDLELTGAGLGAEIAVRT